MEGRLIVASDAGCWRPHITAPYVTLETGRTAMGTSEREAGKIVVEGHLRPAIGGMAGAAVVPELTAVAVILLVASHALGRRIDILPPLMAAVA